MRKKEFLAFVHTTTGYTALQLGELSQGSSQHQLQALQALEDFFVTARDHPVLGICSPYLLSRWLSDYLEPEFIHMAYSKAVKRFKPRAIHYLRALSPAAPTPTSTNAFLEDRTPRFAPHNLTFK